MAESCNQAFGRYLKILRERRGLSLDQVYSLSQTFPERLNKGYLSRCENGHQRLAFSKLIPLSRIYEVPADVLVERMELDLELDRVGSPDTADLSFEELRTAGRRAFDEGYQWRAYAYLRDAVVHARTDSCQPYRDSDEQYHVALMNCGTGALSLGRHKYAFHEFKYVERSGRLSKELSVILFERISKCYSKLGLMEKSRASADSAIRLAESTGVHSLVGYAYSNRAILAAREKNHNLACEYYKKAHTSFKLADLPYECARTLNNLAQAFFDQRRVRSARLAVEAAERVAVPSKYHRAFALGRILLSEIEAEAGRIDTSRRLLEEVSRIARRLDDRSLRFRADFRLLKIALQTGNQSVARAIRRRLVRLTPSLPDDIPELGEFRQLAS